MQFLKDAAKEAAREATKVVVKVTIYLSAITVGAIAVLSVPFFYFEHMHRDMVAETNIKDSGSKYSLCMEANVNEKLCKKYLYVSR